MIALKRNSGNKFEPAEYRLVNKDGIELFKENSSAVQEIGLNYMYTESSGKKWSSYFSYFNHEAGVVVCFDSSGRIIISDDNPDAVESIEGLVGKLERIS